MSLDEKLQDLTDACRGFVAFTTSDEFVDVVEGLALREGQLRYGGPGDWFRSIRWSPAAWVALHGTEGPRGRR